MRIKQSSFYHTFRQIVTVGSILSKLIILGRVSLLVDVAHFCSSWIDQYGEDGGY